MLSKRNPRSVYLSLPSLPESICRSSALSTCLHTSISTRYFTPGPVQASRSDLTLSALEVYIMKQR